MGRDFEGYLADEMFRSAVERKLEIIGEAMGRIAKRAPEVAQQISAHRQIVNFRNVLSHEYDEISHEQVWQVVQHDLPTLRTEVEAILARLAGEQEGDGG